MCAVLLCAGCAARGNEDSSAQGNGFLENSGVSISADSGLNDGGNANNGENAENGADADSGPAEELTLEEIRQFTDFANRTENNGFLLSQYDNVSGADLNEILYNGAGMESDPLTEEEREAYEAAAYPIETDITKLSAAQIEEFLQRKAGIGLADMKSGLDWVYLEGTDCYVSQHGDTNYCAFVCTGGTRRGETYEIRLRAAGDYVPDCIATLKKSGEDYRFVSNRYFENTDDPERIRRIEDQSFSVEMESWGEVEFVSLAPDILENSMRDVTFRLEKAGEEVFAFPAVRDENLRVNDRFVQVEAVAFQDYDEDGYTDVVIICTYEQTEGESAGTRRPEVRIYKGGERTFRYMEQLCFGLNMTGKNQSISQVLEEIREEFPAGKEEVSLRQRYLLLYRI